MSDRLARLLCAVAVAAGLAAVGLGLSVFVEAWQTSRAWVGSAEALHADLPAEAPIWLDTSSSPVAVAGVPTATPAAPLATVQATAPASVSQAVTRPTTSPSTPTLDVSTSGNPAAPTVVPAEAVVPAATPPLALAAPADVELAEADFRFFDPPEPGAHARLAVTLQNRADRPTGPLAVVLPARWLQSFDVLGAIPAVLDDRPGGSQPDGESERQLVFGGLGPGERQTFEIHVIASAEEIDAPAVRVLLAADGGRNGAEIGKARPRTVAPRPRPGPARAVTIPKLGVNAAVVPIAWEPPPFVVGQLQGTAAVSEGNTVLIGHLRGPAGDVFSRLDRLRPGDEVVATSRGLEYRFVVSEIAVRPYDDVQDLRSTDTPRLTMMTCTGSWSIARQDYSHRLWVVAEPPELAAKTIQANAERAAQAAREAEQAAAARATHEAEALASAPPAVDATPQPISEAAPPASFPPAPTVTATAPAVTAASTPEPSSAPAIAEVAPSTALVPESEAFVPGAVIEAPSDGAGVPRQIVVRGRRTAEAPADRPLWLFVRADVAGSRWYALDRPLDVRLDGTWEASIELGGAAGVHHEIRVGIVDAAAEAALKRHASERPGQPLDDLPPGFQPAARVTVERR